MSVYERLEALHARYILNIGKYRFLYFPNRTLLAFIKGPLLNPLSSNQACLRQDFQVFTCSWMADAKFFGNQTAADSVPDKVPSDLRRKVPPRVLQPEQDMWFWDFLGSQMALSVSRSRSR